MDFRNDCAAVFDGFLPAHECYECPPCAEDAAPLVVLN